jgi:predicted phosphodiesterase
MVTLVVSDLHLGTQSGSDLLRRPALRGPLLDALQDVDRLVLLGDTLELRQRPLAAVLQIARPFFEEVGERMRGRPVVMVAGNHDHALIWAWSEARRLARAREPLSLSESIDPAASEVTRRIARWLEPAELQIAYPGLWLRPDVYALHGHYIDCHLTIPTVERLATSLMARVVGDPRRDGSAPDSYEAALTPLYAWVHEVAQTQSGGRAAAGGAQVSARMWRRLAAGPRPRPLAARVAAGTLVPLAVAAANRAGLGPFGSDIGAVELRRAGLRAISEVAARLGIEADHLLYGHTHRAGPFPGDDRSEWIGPGGMALMNTGSWMYQRHFLSASPNESPYWPGTAVRVADSGPPELVGLLDDRGHDELDVHRRDG